MHSSNSYEGDVICGVGIHFFQDGDTQQVSVKQVVERGSAYRNGQIRVHVTGLVVS
jgi:hypothetical protein